MLSWLRDPYPFVRRVIVTTKTDRTFRGLLWEQRRGFLVLREAEALKDRGAVVPVDGELVIERENVDFIQVIGPGAE